MENDSLNVKMPTVEDLGITVNAGPAGEMPVLTVGDTFNFPVTISWSVSGSTLLVLPMGSANAKGITQLGISQESSHIVENGQEKASITFNYKLVAEDTGSLNIPSMRFEIPTQVGAPIEFRSESVPLRVDAPFNFLPIFAGVFVFICVVGFGVWRFVRKKRFAQALAKKNENESALREKMLILKQRVNSADSREWLLELECVCKSFVLEKLGASVCGVESFEENQALALNLEKLQSEKRLDALGETGSWKILLEEFAHARYGGGKRDGFENKETWKVAMKLMKFDIDG